MISNELKNLLKKELLTDEARKKGRDKHIENCKNDERNLKLKKRVEELIEEGLTTWAIHLKMDQEGYKSKRGSRISWRTIRNIKKMYNL